jgi:hypothetical protein
MADKHEQHASDTSHLSLNKIRQNIYIQKLLCRVFRPEIIYGGHIIILKEEYGVVC